MRAILYQIDLNRFDSLGKKSARISDLRIADFGLSSQAVITAGL
jgi:hypothetical protein